MEDSELDGEKLVLKKQISSGSKISIDGNLAIIKDGEETKFVSAPSGSSISSSKIRKDSVTFGIKKI